MTPAGYQKRQRHYFLAFAGVRAAAPLQGVITCN
jgi:hypothetical protein